MIRINLLAAYGPTGKKKKSAAAATPREPSRPTSS